MAPERVEEHTCPHCLRGFGNSWTTESIRTSEPPPIDGPWGVRATVCTLCSRAIIELGSYERSPRSTGGVFTRRARAWPPGVARVPLGKEVPDAFSADYREACAVVEASPKAAAALSRRCLQHLLRDHVKVKASDLGKEIDEVLALNTLPSDLAHDIDAIRNIGNFAAHPMKSTQSGAILDVEPGEAEWTLTVLEELFDFYFVRTAKRAAQRDALNAKIATAKKNAAIKKPPPA